MKKNILLIAIAVVGLGTLAIDELQAQNTPPPATSQPTAPPPGNPGARRSFPPFRNRAAMNVRNSVMMLKRVKTDLVNAKEDYDGHRQSAIEAVDKAVVELEAVQKSIMDAAAKAAAEHAAAAKAAADQQPAVSPPAQPATPAPAQ